MACRRRAAGGDEMNRLAQTSCGPGVATIGFAVKALPGSGPDQAEDDPAGIVDGPLGARGETRTKFEP